MQGESYHNSVRSHSYAHFGSGSCVNGVGNNNVGIPNIDIWT